MSFLRKNWIAVVFLAAVVAFFVVSNHESSVRDHVQHVQLVNSCKRGAARTAIVAAYQHRTADARRATGDTAIADDYDAYALGSVASIPAPPGVSAGDPTMVEVHRVSMPGGKYMFELTAHAKALQAAGCEHANTRH